MSLNNPRSSLEILYNVSRELSATLDLHLVLEKVLEQSTANIGAERASLITLNDKEEALDAALLVNGKLVPSTIEQMRSVLTSGLAGWVIRNRKPAAIADTESDERWLSQKSSEYPQTRSKSALCVPVMAHEKLVGVLTIVHSQTNFFTADDISLQQAIADIAGIAIQNAALFQEARSAREHYHDLFEENIDPIFITDRQGKIIEANFQAVKSTGYAMEELLQAGIGSIHEIYQAKVGSDFENIPAQGSLSYESNLVGKLLKRTPVEVSVSEISLTGQPNLQWIFRDLQERKAMDKLREDLTAMIYHDLRSPLANIISSMEIMSTLVSMEEGTSLKAVYEIATRSTERMQRMISGLLDINRLESGQPITSKEAVPANTLINEAADTITPTAHSKEISLLVTAPDYLPEVQVDKDMMRRVLTNLLENAIKFSPNGSTVKIGAAKKGADLEVWVDDQGPGVPEGAREKIFEKFVQLNTGLTSKGMGLGLTFCQLAVEAHGGKIWVENLPQGGSRFILSIPQHRN
ncbi:MAG: ATP-binding protein [Anaerolineaceae bacterium]|nr:ATP-binding protein [Anaerolineaceae bacterium]